MGNPRKSQECGSGLTALLRPDLRRVLGCEGLRHLAWKYPRHLNSWNGSWVCEEGGVHEAGLFTASIFSLRHRTGSVNYSQGVQNCVSRGVPGLSIDSQRDPGPRKLEVMFVEATHH